MIWSPIMQQDHDTAPPIWIQRHTLPVRAWLQHREPGDGDAVDAGTSCVFFLPPGSLT